MQPGTEQPHFIVEDGAPPGTQEAFNSLVELIEAEPDATAAFFESAGDTPTEIYQHAGSLAPDDESHDARTARLLSAIFIEEFDQEVQLPAADAAARRAEGRNSHEKQKHWRVRRVGFFIGDVANRARANRPEAA
ncbi:MAG: hypothetical protein ABWY71_02540 [Candidatus Saccharimonadales bacterium]